MRFQCNIEAIRTLYQIEREKRAATRQEQEILSRYVGWGGLQHAFNGKNAYWQKEYQELKALLQKEDIGMQEKPCLLLSIHRKKSWMECIMQYSIWDFMVERF